MTTRCTCTPENLGSAVRHSPDCPTVVEAMPPDVLLCVVLHDSGLVTVYSRKETTTGEFAAALHEIADGFTSNPTRRS